MRRVYAVYFLRKLSSPTFMKFLIFAGILRWSVMTVSVPDVIQNSPALWNLPASYLFFSTAFFHTGINTKFLLVALLGVSYLLVRDLFGRTSALEYQNASA